MHTATRLAMPVIDRVRAINPARDDLRLRAVCAAERGSAAAAWRGDRAGAGGGRGSRDACDGSSARRSSAGASKRIAIVPRLDFIQPDRAGLPSLDRYASLQMPDGSSKIVGATDATRGCKHRCRHCPIVPVYDGQFRVVPGRGRARRHPRAGGSRARRTSASAIRISSTARRTRGASSRRCIASFPASPTTRSSRSSICSQHRELLPRAAPTTGCLFITSAVESVDDEVLAKLEKGHTRADFIARRAAVPRCRRDAGADVRRVHAVDDDRGLHAICCDVVADLDLVAQRRAGAVGHPAARHLGIAAARAADIQAVDRPVRCDDADLSVGASRSARRPAAAAGDGARRRARRTRRARTSSPPCASSRRSNLILPSRSAIPYMNEPGTVERSPPQSRLLCYEPSTDSRSSRDARSGSACLLLATTTGYQTRMFAEAAARLGVELVYATDRCDQLDDPWRDGAIAGPLSRRVAIGRCAVEGARCAAGRRRAGGRRSADGDGGVPVAAARPARPSARGRGGGARQAPDAREAEGRRPADAGLHHRAGRRRSATQLLDALTFPVVVKPTVLSGSRGVIRADDALELRDGVRSRAPAAGVARRARAARSGSRRDPDRGIHPRRRVRARRPARATACCARWRSSTSPIRSTARSSRRRSTSRRRASTPAIQRQIEDAVAAAVKALGLHHGPIHAECRVNSRGVFVLEVAARPIGGLVREGAALRAPRRAAVDRLRRVPAAPRARRADDELDARGAARRR